MTELKHVWYTDCHGNRLRADEQHVYDVAVDVAASLAAWRCASEFGLTRPWVDVGTLVDQWEAALDAMTVDAVYERACEYTETLLQIPWFDDPDVDENDVGAVVDDNKDMLLDAAEEVVQSDILTGIAAYYYVGA